MRYLLDTNLKLLNPWTPESNMPGNKLGKTSS
jgi:hypothetical protein